MRTTSKPETSNPEKKLDPKNFKPETLLRGIFNAELKKYEEDHARPKERLPVDSYFLLDNTPLSDHSTFAQPKQKPTPKATKKEDNWLSIIFGCSCG